MQRHQLPEGHDGNGVNGDGLDGNGGHDEGHDGNGGHVEKLDDGNVHCCSEEGEAISMIKSVEEKQDQTSCGFVNIHKR